MPVTGPSADTRADFLLDKNAPAPRTARKTRRSAIAPPADAGRTVE
jgi:hypothetical protein